MCSDFRIVGLPEPGPLRAPQSPGFVLYPSKERAGSEVKWKGPKEFGDFVKVEVVKWTALAREANIQPE
jgi:hypothetical protein